MRRMKHAASRWVLPFFSCAGVMVNFTLNDQFRSEEPVINELMVEIPMFSVRLALTGCLSSLQPRQCASVCVDVEEVGTPHEDFRFFMVRTCCEKGARQNMRTCILKTVQQGQI